MTTPNLQYKKIIGYVGSKKVTAYVYPGQDNGLSHFKLDDKMYMGTAQFNSILSEKLISY